MATLSVPPMRFWMAALLALMLVAPRDTVTCERSMVGTFESSALPAVLLLVASSSSRSLEAWTEGICEVNHAASAPGLSEKTQGLEGAVRRR